MILAFLLFWLVIGWGLYDGSLYAKEAFIFAVIWLPLTACFFLVPSMMIAGIIGIVLIDIILVIKVYGQDILVR
jgi:hypothetical protein